MDYAVLLNWNGTDIKLDLREDTATLLVGHTGTGKSYIAKEIMRQLRANNASEAIKFVLFDLKRVEFGIEQEDYDPAYLWQAVIEDAELGLDALEKLAELASNRSSNKTDKMPFIFCYIEECDMAVTDPNSFEASFNTISENAKGANMAVLYSTSRPGTNEVSPSVLKHLTSIIASHLISDDCKYLGIPDTSQFASKQFSKTKVPR